MQSYLERRLYAYLINRLMKSGSTYNTVSMADVGNHLEASEAFIFNATRAVTRWHDEHGLPSITCMLRPYPTSEDKVIMSDVYTDIARSHPRQKGGRFSTQRVVYFPLVRKSTDSEDVWIMENKIVTGTAADKISFHLNFDQAVSRKNQFEHDLVNTYFFG